MLQENEINELQSIVQRYVSGSMNPDEEVAFELEVQVNPAFIAELSLQSEGLSALYSDLSRNSPAPRNNLKGKILAKISENPDADIDNLHYILTKEQSHWSETIVDGISYKMLYGDEEGRVMVLVRLTAGTSYPDHPHRGTEECYVISGDLQINGHSLTGGDFIAAREGAEHHEVFSNDGCELLLKLPVPYELFPRQ